MRRVAVVAFAAIVGSGWAMSGGGRALAVEAAEPAATSDAFGPVDTLVGSPDPLGILRDYKMLDRITLGAEVVAVVRCVVPADTTNAFYEKWRDLGTVRRRPVGAAAWMQEHVAPYYEEASRGRMTLTFRPAGSVQLGPTEGPEECVDKAKLRTRSTDTNVLAFDSSGYSGGFAGTGRYGPCTPVCIFRANDGVPPSVSERGGYVGGGTVGTRRWIGIGTVMHELGHTLGWPHSYRDPSNEYENRYDRMSSRVYCEEPAGSRCIRDAQHTLAINRYSSGWIDPEQVQVVELASLAETGGITVELDAPLGDGIQFAVVRLTQTRFLTIEARPKIGRDVMLPTAGAAVHEVRVEGECATYCPVATQRRQMPASRIGSASRHVVGIGAFRQFSGVRIENLGVAGDGYQVRLSAAVAAG